MTNTTIQEAIAQAIADYPTNQPGGVPTMMISMARQFPNASEADFDAAMDMAIEILEERAVSNTAESEAMKRLAPLFDGMPEGMSLGECARIKAERGDQLAVEFLKWETAQAGGIQ